MVDMKKALVFLPLLFCLGSCDIEESAQPDLPQGILDFIAEIQQNSTYVGTRLFRYIWNGNDYYEFDIPFSSCIACYLFDARGNRITLEQADLLLYISERGARRLMWEWKE